MKDLTKTEARQLAAKEAAKREKMIECLSGQLALAEAAIASLVSAGIQLESIIELVIQNAPPTMEATQQKLTTWRSVLDAVKKAKPL